MATLDFTINQDYFPDEVFDQVVNEIFNMIVDATPVATGFAQSQWTLDIGDTDARIANDCEYISFLEDGWSDQAPNGMVAPALDALPDLLDSAMETYSKSIL